MLQGLQVQVPAAGGGEERGEEGTGWAAGIAHYVRVNAAITQPLSHFEVWIGGTGACSRGGGSAQSG